MLIRVSRFSLLPSIAAAGALSLVGCAIEDPDTDDEETENVDTAEQAMTSSEGAGEITAVSTYFADSGDLSEAAADLQDDMEKPSCLTVERDGDSATFEFDGCVGRLGFLSITGTLDVTVSESGSVTTYAFSTDELYVNLVQIAGAWDVSVDADTQERTWEGSATLTGPHGHEVNTSTSAAWLWDGQCVTYSANSEIEGPFGGVRTVEVDGVEACLGQCPSAGSVEVTFPNGATLSWTYNGDDTATVVGPRGGVYEVTLPCGY